jgi:hypothetical protein
MKLIIEVRRGLVQNIIATGEVSIYIVDHDNIRERGLGNPEDLAEIRRAQQSYFITWEDGEELTPLFDGQLDEILNEYDPEGLSKP